MIKPQGQREYSRSGVSAEEAQLQLPPVVVLRACSCVVDSTLARTRVSAQDRCRATPPPTAAAAAGCSTAARASTAAVAQPRGAAARRKLWRRAETGGTCRDRGLAELDTRPCLSSMLSWWGRGARELRSRWAGAGGRPSLIRARNARSTTIEPTKNNNNKIMSHHSLGSSLRRTENKMFLYYLFTSLAQYNPDAA